MIQLIDFSKSYADSKNVVSNISFVAEKGSVTGLLGLNGAGKTTIIKAICGIHYATEGAVICKNDQGECYDPLKNIAELKQNIGYVPEQTALPEKFTVKEYLYFVYKLYCGDSEFSNQLEKTSKLCGISEVLSKKIGTLSKGYRQRVSFAQALIHNPDNVILDEPVNGLDPAQIIQFREMIKNISKDKTVLISTHLMQEVEALCDTVHIIANGKLAASGTTESILREYNCDSIEKAFLKICREAPVEH